MQQQATNVRLGKGIELGADISVPDHARGLVLFATAAAAAVAAPGTVTSPVCSAAGLSARS